MVAVVHDNEMVHHKDDKDGRERTANVQTAKPKFDTSIRAKTIHNQFDAPVVRPMLACPGLDAMLERIAKCSTMVLQNKLGEEEHGADIRIAEGYMAGSIMTVCESHVDSTLLFKTCVAVTTRSYS